MIHTALQLLRSGLSAFPIRTGGSKAPDLPKGHDVLLRVRRSTEEELSKWFPSGQRAGLGVLCGPISGGLTVMDFDDPDVFGPWSEIVERQAPGLAAKLVRVHTPRRSPAGNPGVHLAAQVVGDPIKHEDLARGIRPDEDGAAKRKALIEIRGDGNYVVVPPTAGDCHKSGRPWAYAEGSPTLANVPTITRAEWEILADVARSLDEIPKEVRAPATPKNRRDGVRRPGDDFAARGDVPELLREAGAEMEYSRGEVQYWRRPGKESGISATLGFHKTEAGAPCLHVFSSSWDPFQAGRSYDPFAVYAFLKCNGDFKEAARDLASHGFGEERTHGASAEGDPSSAAREGEESAAAIPKVVPLGEIYPGTKRLILSPKRTLPTAVVFVRKFHTRPEGRTLHCWAGLLLTWRENRYVEIEDEALRNKLLPWLHDAMSYVRSRTSPGMSDLVPFDANPTTVSAALTTIRTLVHLAASTMPPCWLDGGGDWPDPKEFVACKTMNVHISSGAILVPTPQLFVTIALDFDLDPNAPPPVRWLAFLQEIFEDDEESIQLLQEWFGYCLTADTTQHKMLLLVGPRRSGKGTIGRVLGRLVGRANCAGPTTSSLAGPFGLQPLLGKSLAVVSDARFTGKDISIVAERLLCISGEDPLTVDRKHKETVFLRLPTRLMFLTNELPRLNETSGALAGRFLIITLTKSFYGRENTNLEDELCAELPGVLKWSLEGRRRLNSRGRFIQPASSAKAVRDVEDLASPVGAFVRACCDLGPAYRVSTDVLYNAWRKWCQREGRVSPSSRSSFGRDLAAVVPGVGRRRGTDDERFYQGIRLRGVE